MSKFNQISAKALVMATVAVGVQAVSTFGAFAGPALFYRYSTIRLNQWECMRKAAVSLRREGLSVREPEVRINNTPFVFADSEDYSAIIDCSQFAKRYRANKRVTVMVSGYGRGANTLSSSLIDNMY
ncbi:hypothetical protein [Acaryochloris sp. IP29b_bin.148]|uniref:hypothetical protein n=1 Tax=Acaryochloris sp. IP29b_bin.148 TaxID=2969218 RepID=UPI002619D3C1|nr:hypothetical protein [Acaryochloris sp. IP29b_bin.148]